MTNLRHVEGKHFFWQLHSIKVVDLFFLVGFTVGIFQANRCRIAKGYFIMWCMGYFFNGVELEGGVTIIPVS